MSVVAAGVQRSTTRALREYVKVILLCSIASLILTATLIQLRANPLPYTQLVFLRTWFTFFTFAHLAFNLIGHNRPYEVVAMTTVPFLTQYYQTALGRDFPDGATSIARLVPYLAMAIAMAVSVYRRGYRVSRHESWLLGVVVAVALTGMLVGLHLTLVGLPVAFFVAVLLPLFYLYVGGFARSVGARLEEFQLGIALGAFMLIGGFFLTYQLALQVRTHAGVGSVDSARNAADFNALVSYLVLSWPFSLAFASRVGGWLLVPLFVGFAAASFGGLSRTMLFMAPILLAVSLPAAMPDLKIRSLAKYAIVVAAILAGVFGGLRVWGETPKVIERWEQRLNVEFDSETALSFDDLTSTVSPGSTSQLLRAEVREQGWRVFYDSPIVGEGWGTFPDFSRVEQMGAHSITVDTLEQVGLVGALPLWLLIALAFRRILRGVATPCPGRRLRIVFVCAFGLWLVAAHTLGSQLFIAAREGFNVSAITGLLFVLYLRTEVVDHATGMEPGAG